MPRLMSFRHTHQQLLALKKSVTRRSGWRGAEPGDFAAPVIQAQGLPKGATVERLGLLVFTEVDPFSVIDEKHITAAEVKAEGFPRMSVDEFIAQLCRAMGKQHGDTITRLAFRLVLDIDGEAAEGQKGCSAVVRRRGRNGGCPQQAIHFWAGLRWCYYHHPQKPKKVGEGYVGPGDRGWRGSRV